MRPAITFNGSKVTVQIGGKTTVHHAQTHDQAIELAAKLEAEADADEQKRAALLEDYIERDIDVVRPAPVAPAAEPPVDPGMIHKPATVEAAMPEADAPSVSVEPTTPEDNVEWSVQAVAPLPASASVSWDAVEGKAAVEIVPLSNASLWRSVAGKTSTFAVSEGKPHTRKWSGKPGDLIEVRVGDEHGPVILEGVVPQPENDQPPED